LENVEVIIKQKRDLLRNGKDIKETDKLLAELKALGWLQAQIVVFTVDNREATGI
jgi:hypothetical protein